MRPLETGQGKGTATAMATETPGKCASFGLGFPLKYSVCATKHLI